MKKEKKSAPDTTQKRDAYHSIESVCSAVRLVHCEAPELL